jgi:hypothetical protein
MTLPQALIDYAFSPPLGNLNPHLDTAGPYAGGIHTLPTWTPAGFAPQPIADTFGVEVQFNGAIPPHLGLTLGYSDGGVIVTDVFDLTLVQLVVQHQFLGGAWAVTQLLDIHVLPTFMRWAEALPGRLGLRVLPGISVDLFYLRIG